MRSVLAAVVTLLPFAVNFVKAQGTTWLVLKYLQVSIRGTYAEKRLLAMQLHFAQHQPPVAVRITTCTDF